MTKLPRGIAILLILLVLVALVGCSASTSALPIDSLIGWNLTSPAEGGQFQWQSAGDSPIIHNASVQPTKVLPGDTMTVTAEVSDSSGISSVTANMGDIETISLSLVEGTIYRGTWQGQWLVHDTTVRDYVTTIVATNSLGKSSATDVLWRDALLQTYERYHNEAYGTIETNSTDWVGAISCNFFPNQANNFLILGRADIGQSSISYHTEARVVMDESTANIIINAIDFYPAIADEIACFGAHDVVYLDATAHTFEVQYRTSNALGTASITNYGLNFFQVDDYHHVSADSEQTTTSNSYVMAANVTFIPASTGEYLVWASWEILGTNDAKVFFSQLTGDNGTEVSWGDISREPTNVAQWHHYETMRKVTLGTVSQTLRINYHTEAGNDITIRRARITAVRISDLGHLDAYSEVEDEASTTSLYPNWVSRLDLEVTPPDGTYVNTFRAGQALLQGSKTSAHVYGGIFEDGSLIGMSSIQPNDTADYLPLWTGFHRYHEPTPWSLNLTYCVEQSNPQIEASNTGNRLLVIHPDTMNAFVNPGHTTIEAFDTPAENMVYVQGCFFPVDNVLTNLTLWNVRYYDGNGFGVQTEANIYSGNNGVINSQYDLKFDRSAAEGTWHAVAYYELLPPSANYTAFDPLSTKECEFTVAAAAIPEFPTALAGIGVAGLCFVIYWWMRRRAATWQSLG